jgi:hypothetical protein
MKLLLVAVLSIPLVVSGALAQSPSATPGVGQAQNSGMNAAQEECRRQADAKGLRGPSKRAERQAFMQSCVHGPKQSQ